MRLLDLTRTLAQAAVVVLATACGGGSDSASPTPQQPADSVQIVSVSPTSAQASQSTAFTVEVRYALHSVPSGVIDIGFFISATEVRLTGTRQLVSTGEGTATLTVTVVPQDYTATSAFGVEALLSPEPHPPSWTALDTASQRIPLVP